MDIKQYILKKISLIDVDGIEYKGRANYTTSGDNDDQGEQVWLKNVIDGRVYEFYPDEIKSIEVIED